MSEQQDILHCPFCGYEAKAYASHYANLGEHWVICLSPNCGGKTHWWASREQAIAAWNQRSMDAELDRLRELERAVRDALVLLEPGRYKWGMLAQGLEDGDGPAYGHEIDAIGRLLEGENA